MRKLLEADCSAEIMMIGVPAANPIGQLVVKVTYGIRGGKLEPAYTQLPVWLDDTYHGGRFYSGDYQFPKEKIDLVVIGDAVAPGEEPAEQVDVAISVGGFSRKLLVIGDRYWRESRGDADGQAAKIPPPTLGQLKRKKADYSEGLSLPPQIAPPKPEEKDEDEDDENADDGEDKTYVSSQPARFKRIRMDWDRSYGGEDGGAPYQDNPGGKGFILQPGDKDEKPVVSGVPLPNIEDPAQRITSWKSNPKPVGPCFYPQTWGLRMLKGMQLRDNKPPCVLAAMFNQAHPDFELDAFPDDQEMTIKGMTPVGDVKFLVEKPTLSARLELAGKPDRDLNLVWDLLCVRPELGEVYMVARAPFKFDPATDYEINLRVFEPSGVSVNG
jgi:hypothetical protein